MPENEKTVCPIAKAVDKYIQHIESLNDSLPMSLAIVSVARKTAIEKFFTFVKEKNIAEKKTGNMVSYQVKMEDLTKFTRLKQRVDKIILSEKNVSESFFVSMISHFDAYISNLIRALFMIKPEVLNSTDKILTYPQLLQFNNVEDARNYIVEKEIETVMRESHVEQFNWLEKKFSIKLRVDLPSWTKFIEMTERRNLYVHCDGKVSSQYLHVCQENGVEYDKEIKIGDRLEIDAKYFQNAYRVLFELGVKLANVFWRKFIPGDIEKADTHLNGICYDLISFEEYNLAANLLDFATEILKSHKDSDKRVLVVNRAQAYKWLGNAEKSIEILDKEDWSACNDQFRLANAVLKDNYAEVFNIMEAMGKDEEMRIAYKEWPLFKEFRENPDFIEKYKNIFGEEFCVTEFDDLFDLKPMKPIKVEKKRRLRSVNSK